MREVKQISDSEFEQEVVRSKVPVVVYFWSSEDDSGAPVSAVLDRAADRYGPELLAVKVNVAENPVWAQQLGIVSLPTLIFFVNGAEVNRSVGAINSFAAKVRITAFMSA